MCISVLGKNIKRLREFKNMSQADLVRKAGVGKATINEIENGKRKSLNSNTINKISIALNVPVEELFIDENKTEYSITDIREAFNLILSSDELTLNNKELSYTEKALIEDTINDVLDFIVKKRNKLNN
ncbi:helix-turn-helix domain-containing protein [Clostridium perfringens]|uniref:helix-turn-helix domain-containing protein n=1 Tax=Clostridium perfringens TaxID=1502 RepID=UPI001ABA66E4|nr:helix-turn-helix transcriptional regulator [Clostridium perfringens]MBO3344352.1 helix-turn-helix transcriptional regulator [Clostridium perfringens]MBO3347037.1 helix-turn-helix transcriptional regulator [Clostridium perfringens]MBO3350093.1 helix-turn-helix transcriptional regulator [Clostridium perfringens]MBO3370739.1 helix-turn-helix transcriptional regulator [Clostridium perfringens]HBC2029748.1 helix-turn-helix transcriptional regulator [Clostridium perfringens]